MWQIIEGLKPEKNLALILSLLGPIIGSRVENYIKKWYFRKISLSILCRKEKPWLGGWPECYWKNPRVRWKGDRLEVHLKGSNDKGK